MIKFDKLTSSYFALAQLVEQLGGKCAYCEHEYESVDDLFQRKPLIVRVREFGLGCACEKCWEKENERT